MALFEVRDSDRRIYEEEIRDFLPDKIIDIHTHIWLNSLRPVKKELNGESSGTVNWPSRVVTWPSLVAPDNCVEDLQETYRLLFPGKEVTPLMFTSPANRDDWWPQNEYTRVSAQKTGYPALFFSTPEQSCDELEEILRRGGFLGLKSYLFFAKDYLPEKEIRIYDFFPKHQLKRMDELGAIVMLHIPRDGRLKDPVNLAQICEIKEEFPNVKLIIAHIGRAYVKEDVGNAFEVLAPYKDLMFDFCANCCEYAIYELFRNVGPDRAMFGSDLPILRMRTHRIEENGTYINLIPPGLYGDPSQDPHLREVSPEEAEKITFFMYEEILAAKRAANRLGFGKEEIEKIFYGNAAKLIADAKKSIYGA